MNYNQTFLHIKNQLPVQFQNNYDLFIKFMEYYYQFIDENVFNRDIENLRNIEKTSADLYKFVLHEYSILPDMDFSEFDFFTSMKHFYRKKGTSDSFKQLFEQLYNEKIEVSYPADRTFTLSEGEWIQNKSFFVKVTNDNTLPMHKISLLNGQKINLISGNNIYSVFVENVRTTFSLDYETKEKKYSDSFIEIFYTNTNKIPIDLDDILVANIGEYIFKAKAINVVTKYTILNGGKNFKKGEILNCEYKDDNTLMFKIIDVDENGTILTLDILNSSPYIDNDVIIDLKHVDTSANESKSNMNKLTISYNKQKKLWSVEVSEAFSAVKTFKEKGILYRQPEGKKTPFGFKEQDYLNMDIGIMYDDKNGDHYNKKDLMNILRYFPVNEVEPSLHQYYYDLNKPNSIKETFYNNEYDLQLGKYNFFKESNNYNARIKLFTTNIIKKKGYYINNKSFLSDTIYLAGGNYYHNDSYVIHSEHSISEWQEIVKNTIHPSGSAMFSEYLYDIYLRIEPYIHSSLDIKTLWITIFDKLNIFKSKELHYNMNVSVKEMILFKKDIILKSIFRNIFEKIQNTEKLTKHTYTDLLDKIISIEKFLKSTSKLMKKEKISLTNEQLHSAIHYVKKILGDKITLSDTVKKLIEKYLTDEIKDIEDFFLISNRKITIKEKIVMSPNEELLDIRNGMYYELSFIDNLSLYDGGYIEPYTEQTKGILLDVKNYDLTWNNWIKVFGDSESREKIKKELDKKDFILNVKESDDSYGIGIGIINK